MKQTTVPMLYRMRHIVHKLRSGYKVKTTIIADELEVSTRTVARDIGNLIHYFGLPIVYDRHMDTYKLLNPTASDLELLS